MRAFSVLALAVLAAGCRDAVFAMGGSGLGAADRASNAFQAVAMRYTNVHHGAKYEYARDRLGEATLTPSKVFDDTAVWTTSPTPTGRVLQIRERVTPTGVNEQEAMPDVPWPTRLGDARHVVVLTNIAHNEYAWDTDVSFALGAITAEDVSRAITTLLTSAQGRTEAQLRADYRATMPRTTQALGQLLSLDTLHTTQMPDGSTLLTLYAGVHPEGMARPYPRFAQYVQKYVNGTRFHFTLSDREGAPYVDIVSTGPTVTVRLRALHDQLMPITGPERAMADTLVLTGSFSAKIKLWTVGVRQFSSDFIIGRGPHERSWTMVFRREPDWQLPMIAERLLRTPLRRPFQGPGTSFRVSVHDTAGAQSTLTRRLHAEVQESAILRFMGGLIAKVFADLGGDTEKEEFAFLSSVFDAARLDARAALGGS